MADVTTLVRYGLTELDRAGERVQGRLSTIGTLEYALSDAQGNLEAGTLDVEIYDTAGRPIGTLMETDGSQHFQRDELVVHALSIEGRTLGTTPSTLGRALTNTDTYGTGAIAKLSGTDPIFCDTGAFGPDRKIPTFAFPDIYQVAPVDVYSKLMPLVLGEYSDEGAVDPVTNTVSARGLLPLTFVGMDQIATGASGLPEPWGRFNVCLYAAKACIGLYGADLSSLLYGIGNALSDGSAPSVITLGGSPDLTIVVDALLAQAAAQAGSTSLPTDPALTITLWTLGGLGTVQAQITAADNTAKTVTITATIPTIDTTGLPTPFGTIAAGVDWVIGTAPATRVKIDLSTRNGSDCMVWGWPNYLFNLSYQTITDSAGVSYRVQDIWVRGPLLDFHLNGTITLAMNVAGVEDIGDGNGELIRDYFEAYSWFCENVLYRDTPEPSGQVPGNVWPQVAADLLTFTDTGITRVYGLTFRDAQAWSARLIGGRGFQIGGVFGGAGISTRDAMQRWNDNGACRTGINEYGQVFVWVLDRFQDPSAWPSIEHVSRVFGSVSRTHEHTEIENVVQGSYDWDEDGQRYREPLVVRTSATGIRHNKGIRRPSKLIGGQLTRDLAQFTAVLEERKVLNQDGPVYVTFTGDIGLMDYAVGSGILFTSVMGPGALGFVLHPLIILKKSLDFTSRTVTVRCLDVARLLPYATLPLAGRSGLVNDNSQAQLDNTGSMPLM